ncbi:MAG: nucleotidyltransferase domain-containing protein [Sedimentisphaerales bacterium]|nr:nucleotidyltransferase domain-containing protein [Sedimentisphaerales bacterium]
MVRNEAGSESDIDIMVDFAEPTFDHYMDLEFYLEKLFGREVDLVIADNVKPRLKPLIDKEVIYAKGL